MQSHVDRDLPADFWPRLEERASHAMKEGAASITGGLPGEPILAEWRRKTLTVIQRPDDEQNILRISIGGGVPGADIGYCVFRGDRAACAVLLEEALEALRSGP